MLTRTSQTQKVFCIQSLTSHLCLSLVLFAPSFFFSCLELNAALGDGLAASGAIMYGISNVAQEYLVKKHGETEFRAMIGIFGAFVSGTQACVLFQITYKIRQSQSFFV